MNQKNELRAENAIRTLITALLDTVRDFPDGAPSGPMYMAVSHIITLDQYEAIMGALVTAGKIRHSNDQYFPINPPTQKEEQS